MHLIANRQGPTPHISQAEFETGLRGYLDKNATQQPRKFTLIPFTDKKDSTGRYYIPHRSGSILASNETNIGLHAGEDAVLTEIKDVVFEGKQGGGRVHIFVVCKVVYKMKIVRDRRHFLYIKID